MIKLDKITEIEIKDDGLTISQFDNEVVILTQDNLKKLLEAINYTHCCKSDSEQLFDFLEWFNNYCTVDIKPNKEDVELYLSK